MAKKTPKIPDDSSPRNYLSAETVIAERMLFQKDLQEAILEEEKRMTLAGIAKADYSDMNINLFDNMNQYMNEAGIATKGLFAMTWMKNAIQELYDVSEELSVEEKFFRDSKRIQTRRAMKKPGELFLFNYNPTNKSKLPYYDTFPLVFIIENYTDGFLGMNLHYLPIPLRERLFLNLLPYATGDVDVSKEGLATDQTRIKLTYDLLNKTSKLRFFRPCVRRYKYNRIDSRLLKIPSADWMIAIYLPIERFVKKKRGRVWVESRRAIAKRMKD
tara:strand:+ start:327 stop:1145 length:819 start_codon:yes stop_codon:yes gene_type:complete